MESLNARFEVNEIIYINITTLSASLLNSLNDSCAHLSTGHRDSHCTRITYLVHVDHNRRDTNYAQVRYKQRERNFIEGTVSRRIHTDRKTPNPNKYDEGARGFSTKPAGKLERQKFWFAVGSNEFERGPFPFFLFFLSFLLFPPSLVATLLRSREL